MAHDLVFSLLVLFIDLTSLVNDLLSLFSFDVVDRSPDHEADVHDEHQANR